MIKAADLRQSLETVMTEAVTAHAAAKEALGRLHQVARVRDSLASIAEVTEGAYRQFIKSELAVQMRNLGGGTTTADPVELLDNEEVGNLSAVVGKSKGLSASYRSRNNAFEAQKDAEEQVSSSPLLTVIDFDLLASVANKIIGEMEGVGLAIAAANVAGFIRFSKYDHRRAEYKRVKGAVSYDYDCYHSEDYPYRSMEDMQKRLKQLRVALHYIGRTELETLVFDLEQLMALRARNQVFFESREWLAQTPAFKVQAFKNKFVFHLEADLFAQLAAFVRAHGEDCYTQSDLEATQSILMAA